MPYTSRPYFTAFALGATVLAGGALAMPSPSYSATVAKAGGKCAKLNATSGELVCVKKLGKLVWNRTTSTTRATSTTRVNSSTSVPTAAASASVTTTAPSGDTGGSNAAPAGIEGSWKPTAKSLVGYRVKEVLFGQSTEGVGRTNAVSGKMVIVGTKVTAVELIADLTKLESDSNRRDGQVQSRILETAKFPTATLKLSAPLDFSAIPGDKEEVKVKAVASMTIHGVTKQVSIDVAARRNGPGIEVSGVIPFLLSDYNIPDPSVADVVTTEQKGLLEFLVVFER